MSSTTNTVLSSTDFVVTMQARHALACIRRNLAPRDRNDRDERLSVESSVWSGRALVTLARIGGGLA